MIADLCVDMLFIPKYHDILTYIVVNKSICIIEQNLNQ